MNLKLTPKEALLLRRRVNGSGGPENLLRKLRRQLDVPTRTVSLDSEDREKIPRYASWNEGRGGFQWRLTKIFRRGLKLRLRKAFPEKKRSGIRLRSY